MTDTTMFARQIDKQISEIATDAAAKGDDLIVTAFAIQAEIEKRHGIKMGANGFTQLLAMLTESVNAGLNEFASKFRVSKDATAANLASIDRATLQLRKQLLGRAASTVLDLTETALKQADRVAADKRMKSAI